MCYSPRLHKNLDDLRKDFELHLESLDKLTPEHDDADYAKVFVLIKAATPAFKKHVRVAEKRIREAKCEAKVPVKKPESS